MRPKAIGGAIVALVAAVVVAVSAQTGPQATQGTTTDHGEWPYLGGSASHTRSSPLNQTPGVF